MVLSILICSLESRHEALEALLKELLVQINAATVDISQPVRNAKDIPCIVAQPASRFIEILTEVDNKEMTTGKKRNLLLLRATGKYVIWVDDDDWVEPCYISELLKAAESDADCFAMNGWITTNGTHRIDWRLSKNYETKTIKENGHKQVYLRKTNHITGVKREIALQVGFPDISNAEDKWYSERVAPLCKTEHQIVPMMYHYRFNSHNKEYV